MTNSTEALLGCELSGAFYVPKYRQLLTLFFNGYRDR